MGGDGRRRWKERLGPLYLLFVAVQFLTRIPVPRDLDPEIDDLADSAVWFPVVGAIVGGMLGGLALLLVSSPLITAVAAMLVVVAGVLMTGAFHEDAIGDTADGMGGAWQRDRVLEIMRDSRVGTYATVAIVCLLGLRAGFLMGTRPTVWLQALVVAHVSARASTLVMLRLLPYARREGEDPGFGKPLVDAQTVPRVAAGLLSAGLICLVTAGWSGLAALALMLAVCFASAHYYRRRIDGMTGDCLGATNVVTEVAVLFWFALLHPATTSAWMAT